MVKHLGQIYQKRVEKGGKKPQKRYSCLAFPQKMWYTVKNMSFFEKKKLLRLPPNPRLPQKRKRFSLYKTEKTVK